MNRHKWFIRMLEPYSAFKLEGVSDVGARSRPRRTPAAHPHVHTGPLTAKTRDRKRELWR